MLIYQRAKYEAKLDQTNFIVVAKSLELSIIESFIAVRLTTEP